MYPSLTLLPLPFCFQEHADVSDSLGRRLREEAEVNAALSQVSAFQLSSVSSSSVRTNLPLFFLTLTPFSSPSGEACSGDAISGPKGREQGALPARALFFNFVRNLSQVLQEELAKYKQQAEKARVQKLQQVRAPYENASFCFERGCRLGRCKEKAHLAAAVTLCRVGGLRTMSLKGWRLTSRKRPRVCSVMREGSCACAV